MGAHFFQDNRSKEALTQPPTYLDELKDKTFRTAALLSVLTLFGVVVTLFGAVIYEAFPAMQQFGFGFITGTQWSSARQEFGILPEIWGTLYSSLFALFLGGGLGVVIAIFLTQRFIPEKLAHLLRTIIELLAAIPSVVYGLWGIFVLIPAIRPIAAWLHEHLGWFPLFSSELNGPGLFPAIIVLSVMILPTVAAVSIDALKRIPAKTHEAVYGMGATRYEAITKVMLPTASSGLLAALILGFGRALGETMALAMLIGSSNQISLSIFSPANTLASLMASSFPEAGELEIQALMYAAVVLLMITFIVNILGLAVQQMTKRKFEGQ
ncbi:phosphate ABC transporter permease subunit PstC [Vibrio sp.]|nr:phosphate ABC transporter permease subunit PstC [Vibrio sp.]